jgi:L-glutamine-phosphate cytidylyltransferase
VPEAIILAAGIGSRLRQVHRGVPKCLVPVAGRPILEWQLRSLVEVGADRVVIVTGYEAERVRRQARSLNLPLELAFVENPEYRSTNVLSSWALGSEFLSDTHFYMHGDTVFEPELLRRLAVERTDGIVLTVDRRPCGDEEMKVATSAGRIKAITKQMAPSEALGEFTGVLKASGEVLGPLRRLAVEVLSGSDGQLAFFEAALQLGIDRAMLNVDWIDVTDLRWREVDFPEDLEAAEALMSLVGGSAE